VRERYSRHFERGTEGEISEGEARQKRELRSLSDSKTTELDLLGGGAPKEKRTGEFGEKHQHQL